MDLDLAYDQEGHLLDQEDILLDVYREAESYETYPKKKGEKQKYRAAGRILAWLGLATPNKFAEFGYKPSRILLRLNYNLKTPKPNKYAATYEEIDAIELIFDAALGEDKGAPTLRSFARNVLGVLGLVRFTRRCDPIPTPELREMAGHRRQKERSFRKEQRRRRQGEKACTQGTVKHSDENNQSGVARDPRLMNRSRPRWSTSD
jgi:hypothetical protein